MLDVRLIILILAESDFQSNQKWSDLSGVHHNDINNANICDVIMHWPRYSINGYVER